MLKRFCRCLFLITALAALLAGCSHRTGKAADPDLTLQVALYPYVPDPEGFRAAVGEAWEREHPDVELRFADWDCYSSDPAPELDVFVFDGIYLTAFSSEGYLLPIPEEEIRDREDIIPFALDGCFCGEKLYALPQLLCGDFLYTRKGDEALSGVSDIMELYEVVGDRKTDSVMPEENEGLLINLSDVFLTKSVMYLDALMDERKEYTEYDELPGTADLSGAALDRLAALWKMGGREQVGYWPADDDAYVRARWFADGRGRAYIGYAEAMAAMGDYAEDVDVRLFSYGTRGNIPLFYTDMVGISSKIAGEKKELALDLANILISGEVLSEMSRPPAGGGSPQYLLTARRSVYEALAGDYPIYGRLRDMVDGPDNHVFRMGAGVRRFLADMEQALERELSGRN